MKNLCQRPSMTVVLILTSSPASKVRQLAKRMEMSKATAQHMKQVASDPQAVQINLMRHQQTTSHQANTREKLSSQDHPVTSTIPVNNKCHHTRTFYPKQAYTSKDRCSKCSDSRHVEGFKCPAMMYLCKSCHKYGHFTCLCFKKQVPFKPNIPKAHPLQAEKCTCKMTPYVASQKILPPAIDSFCLQVKIQHAQAKSKLPTTSHLITNLAYKLKPHHTRNQYLRARLDTCTDVNIMPASVYKLVFHDPDLKKLAPSKLEIETNTDTLKLAGYCTFYLVHPFTK